MAGISKPRSSGGWPMLAPPTCTSISRQPGATPQKSSAPERTNHRTRSRARPRRSDLDLLLLHDALDCGALEHSVLQRTVILEFFHRQLAAHAPGVEHEGIGIEHGVFFREPFPTRQHIVDLPQIAVERLEPGLF